MSGGAFRARHESVGNRELTTGNRAMKKKNKSSLVLSLAAAVGVIGGGVTAYWVIVQSNPSSGNQLVGANLIPQDALMAVSVSTNPTEWQQLREFGTPETQAAFDQTVTKMRDRFLTPNGYNYEEHIQPWVGQQVTLAFLSPPAKSPVGKLTQQTTPSAESEAPQLPNQSVVVVLPIGNPLQAKQILDQPSSPFKKNNWVERDYKGVLVRETQNSPGETYSISVLENRLLVIATDPKATDRVIDAYQSGASLARTPGYSEAMRKIQADRPFAKLYVNIPAAAAAAKNSQQQISPQGLAQLQQQQGLASTISLEAEGIRFKSISWLKPNSQKKYLVQNNADMMPKQLPANTLMMISGGNLRQFWQEYTQGADSNPMTPIKPEDLRKAVKSFSDLDLDRDLFGWMGGEFSLSLIPPLQNSKEDSSASFAPGVVFMVKASDRTAGEKAFAQISDVMSNRYSFKTEKEKVGNQPVVNMTSPLIGIKMTQGWLDSNIAFLTLGAPVTNAIAPQPKKTLAESQLFQSVVPSELNPNNGRFFIDIDRLGVDSTANLLSFLLRLSPDPNTQKTLRTQLAPIQAIGGTTAVSDEKSTRFDVFVKVKKVSESKSLPTPSIAPESSPKPSP